jgi:hypothetical protein
MPAVAFCRDLLHRPWDGDSRVLLIRRLPLAGSSIGGLDGNAGGKCPTRTLREAVAKTFDGAHPCDLCHIVADGKKSEKKSEVLPAVVKMDLICTLRTLTWLPPWISYEYPRMNSAIPERFQSPPVPPPRSLLG